MSHKRWTWTRVVVAYKLREGEKCQCAQLPQENGGGRKRGKGPTPFCVFLGQMSDDASNY